MVVVRSQLPFICFILIHLFKSIKSQMGEELKGNGSFQRPIQIDDPSDKFSTIPNGMPLKRVNLLGNQLLLRQMFVEPLRSSMNDDSMRLSWAKKGQQKREANGEGARGEAGGCFREKKRRRRRQQMSCTCIGCADAIIHPQNGIAPLPVQITPLSLYKSPSQQANGPGQVFLINNAIPNGEQSAPFQLQSQHSSVNRAANRQRAAIIVHRPDSDSKYATVAQIAQKYPLPECYTGESNFMCCNAQLEETIHHAFQHLTDTIQNFHKCNIQKISTTVQSFAEKRFNISFEVVTGLTDYASKSHFYSNYICKVQKDKRYILAYATPRWEIEETSQKSVYPVANPHLNSRRNKNNQFMI